MTDVAFLIEYSILYAILVLIPAVIRSVIDTAILKIPKNTFELPSASALSAIQFHSFYSNVVSTALFYPLFEEILFRGAPLALTGIYGFILANAVWVLMHPAWQVRYVTHLPLKTQIGFVANTAFYYTCAGTFFAYGWLKGYPLYAILFHMGHNFLVVLAGILSDIELPAPWKREEFFKEERGFKKKVGEFFRDEKPVPISDEELDAEYNLSDKFYKQRTENNKTETKKRNEKQESESKTKKQEKEPQKEAQSPKADTPSSKVVAKISDDWILM